MVELQKNIDDLSALGNSASVDTRGGIRVGSRVGLQLQTNAQSLVPSENVIDNFASGFANSGEWSVLNDDKPVPYALGGALRSGLGLVYEGLTGAGDFHAAGQAFDRGNYVQGTMYGLRGIASAGMAAMTAGDFALVTASAGRSVGIDSLISGRLGEHALERHGGLITDEQLMTRAYTGVAPDGSRIVRNGQVQIPPFSTAFNSDELLARSDLLLRQSYLHRAIALSPAGAQVVTIEGVETGAVVGRGFGRITSTPGGAGPLQYSDNLTKVTGSYRFDAGSATWRTVTIYPVRR